MSIPTEAIERVAEFARQYRMRLDVPADGKIYTVWIDPNAEEATLNLNDLEALTAAAPHIQAAALREFAHTLTAMITVYAERTTEYDAGWVAGMTSAIAGLTARADQLEGKTE